MTRKVEPNKLGFFRKSKSSNKRLINLFESNQKLRYQSQEQDWGNKIFLKRLQNQESQAKKEILQLLKKGKIKTSDDFYRAAWLFHHSSNFRHYALAVALASTSWLMGEPWGKNLFATTMDRFLLSIRQPQYFTTQYKKTRGAWLLFPYNRKVTDKTRKWFHVGTLKEAKNSLKELSKNRKTLLSLPRK